jgi:hypothetical protein
MNRLSHVAGQIGDGQQVSRILSDAQLYWLGQEDPGWVSNSHWRNGIGEDNRQGVGKGQPAIFEQFARALTLPTQPEAVVDGLFSVHTFWK